MIRVVGWLVSGLVGGERWIDGQRQRRLAGGWFLRRAILRTARKADPQDSDEHNNNEQ